jgi:isoleucyl-tRNA synthetase
MDAKSLAQAFEKGLSVEVKVNGHAIKLLAEEVEIKTMPKKGYGLAEGHGIIVGIETLITEELELEGLARDLVRHIQHQRKKANFKIADHIQTYYITGPKLTKVFETHGSYIAAETLSTSIVKDEPKEGCHFAELKIGGQTIRIGLVRVPKQS